jgi:hypothetical protein
MFTELQSSNNSGYTQMRAYTRTLEIINKLATEKLFSLKLKLNYDRQSVCHSVLVSGTHLGPATSFSFFLKFPLDSCGFVTL